MTAPSLLSEYQGRRVLVTGGLGFIGLNLVGSLLDHGAQVDVLTRSAPPQSIHWLDHIRGDRPVRVVQGDIADNRLLREVLEGQQIVFNLAGQSGASKSILQAHEDMHANIEGHLNMLEIVTYIQPPPRIIFVSSRLVYGVPAALPVIEQHPTEPTSIYGLHKLTVEHYYRLYYIYHNIPYAILRLTNPYGPYQSFERQGYGIVNQFVMRALKGTPITIYGDGEQLRDYIYIKDAVLAMLLAGVHPNAACQTFNLGYGSGISLRAMAELIVQLAGQGEVKLIPWPELDRKVETGDFICDIQAIKQALDWEPSYDWTAGLRETIDQYRPLLAST